jgi:uncharacterized membrane protein
MRLKFQSELVLIDILAVLLIIIIAFIPIAALRIILGLPFLLFFPGYVLIAALFPKATSIGGFERVALSFGFSIAVTGLVGLALNYTPWGINLYPVVISLTVFIIAMSVIAWSRRRRLPQEERYTVDFVYDLSSWKSQTLVNRVISVALIAVIIGAVGILGYAMASPQIGERYTEFYILGMEGKSADYPLELEVGQEGTVVAGIINREHEVTQYRLEVRIGEAVNNVLQQLVLEHDEKWEDVVVFIPQKAGNSQKVEFLLYNLNNSDSEVYRQLHFWVDVADRR